MQRSFLRKFLGLRLGTKSFLAVTLLLSAVSIILTSFFISRQENSLMEELQKRAKSLSSNLAFNSQYAVLSRDNSTLRNLIEGVVKESDIEQACITDLDGVILAHQDPAMVGGRVGFTAMLDSLEPQRWLPTERKNVWRAVTLIEYERKPLDTSESILFSSPEGGESAPGDRSSAAYREKLGFAVLDVSLRSMNTALAAGTRQAVIITLIMIVLGALAVIYLVRSVAVPISHMADATRTVAGGDLDQEVPIRRRDEIGVLASSFNHMIRQLRVSRERIEAWNRELEAKVTERTRELEEKHEELEKAYESLKTLDKAKDDFLSLVSHELRTPLSAVLLYSEMLLDGVADTEEARNEFLTTIVENCKRLTRLINDVLDLSKIEAGRMPFKLEAVNFKDVVVETLSGIRPKLESKKIHFDFADIDEKCSLWGDRDKVIQVLTNIISNAVKYTGKDGKISVSFANQGDMVKIAVEDTGKGIRKEDIPKVFDRFCQLESIDHHFEGTGLGMTISKSIIERLGGRIWIDSELGRGTSVYFTLPNTRRGSRKTREQALEHGFQQE